MVTARGPIPVSNTPHWLQYSVGDRAPGVVPGNTPGTAFIAWIHDLSAADPLYLLPIFMAASMFLSQKMTPQMGMDPAQQRMMNVMMPVMMGIFFFKLRNVAQHLRVPRQS